MLLSIMYWYALQAIKTMVALVQSTTETKTRKHCILEKLSHKVNINAE